MINTQTTLLFVDDEENILASLKRLFRPQGYRIFTASSGAEGLELLVQETIDLVVSDMRMPEMDGAEFLEKVANQWPETVRILLTGYADLNATIAAINNGHIYRYVAKPWQEHELTLTVQQALELKQLADEKRRLEQLTQQQNEALKTLNATLEQKVADRTEELRQTMGFLEEAYISLKKPLTPAASELCLKSAALEKDMVLTQDLIAPNGVLLLAKDHQLSNTLIHKIAELEKTMEYDLTFYVKIPPTR